MGDRYRDYILKFLKQEAACLADVSDRAGDEQHIFHSSGQITEVEQRFLEVMSILNRVCLDVPAGIDLLSDDAEISRVDQHWRAKFPPWFSGIFIVLPPKDNEITDARHEIFTRWLSDFSIENRYCFYVGHEIKEDKLIVGVEYSEDPAPTLAFIDLVEKCGCDYLGSDSQVKPLGVFQGLLRKVNIRK